MIGAVLGVYVAITLFGWGLNLLNLKHLRAHGQEVPEELAGVIDAGTLRRISAYTLDTSRLALIRSAVHSILTPTFLFGGLLGWYDGLVSSWTGS